MEALITLRVWLAGFLVRSGSVRQEEDGDVPGWVLITVMTAGLVAAIWAIAGNELASMLRDALNSVRR